MTEAAPDIEKKAEEAVPVVDQKEAVPAKPAAKAAEASGPSTVQQLKQFLVESVFLQHLLLIPVVIVLSYYIGGIIIWPVFIGISLYLSIKALVNSKKKVYDDFIESMADDDVTYIQEVAWLNQIVTKYWISCVPALVKPHIDRVSATLTENKPPFMHKLEIGKWSFGKKGPRFSQIRTTKEPDSSKYVLDGELIFAPDFSLELRIEPIKMVVVKILLSGIVFKGRLRIRFNLNEEVPNASIVSVCFVGDPQIAFAIRPLGSVDMLSLPKLYDWINDTIMNAIKPLMVWPQKLQFTLGQGEVVSEHGIEEPITDIAIIDTEELGEPPGFLIVEKVCGGTLPANVNFGNKGRELYLTYRRDPAGEPITKLAVVCPSQGDTVPEGFTMIETTPAGLSANLNEGTKGPPVYLCYSKEPGCPPITGIGLINLKNRVVQPDNTYTRIDISPSGKSANINNGVKGCPAYIAYRGGSRSNSGYPIPSTDPSRGLLRVGLIEGDNLKAADLNGTSDPYCTLTVGDPTAKKLPKQTSSVIDCTLNPVWDESFVFEACTDDILTINLYDKDQIGSDDFLGKIQVPLNALMMGKSVEQWIPLQLVSKGFLHLSFTAVNFGLPDDGEEAQALECLECTGSSSLFSKINPVKGVMNVGRLGSSGGIVRNKPKRPVREAKQEAKNKEPGDEFISLTGHIEKLPTKSLLVGINQGWQRRWLVLNEHKLSYCRSSKDSVSNALGSVGLKNASIEAGDDNEYTFNVVTSVKTIQCKAESEEEFLDWFHAIKTNIKIAGQTKSRFEEPSEQEPSKEED